MRNAVLIAALGALAVWGLIAAALSPYLAFRQPVYILAGFAGIVALVLMVAQPLLAAGLVPGIGAIRSRRAHIGLGLATVVAVMIHVGALWVTSPPDVVDALLFRSPTPFSAWGVIAMVAILSAAAWVALRPRLSARGFRLGHATFVVVAVLATLPHAWLIEGTMGTVSKAGLLIAAPLVLAWVLVRRRTFRLARRRKA